MSSPAAAAPSTTLVEVTEAFVRVRVRVANPYTELVESNTDAPAELFTPPGSNADPRLVLMCLSP